MIGVSGWKEFKVARNFRIFQISFNNSIGRHHKRRPLKTGLKTLVVRQIGVLSVGSSNEGMPTI